MPRCYWWVLALAAGLLLSACTLQTSTIFQPDGAGELHTEVGLTVIDQQTLKATGATPDSFCKDMQSGGQLPPGVELRLEKRGTETWCVFSNAFADLAKLRELYGAMAGVKVNTLSLTNGQLVYDVDIDASQVDLSQAGALAPSLFWQVTMPGRVLSQNADRTKGKVLTWDLSQGKVVHAQATSELTGGNGLFGLEPSTLAAIVIGLCCCLGLLSVLAVTTVVVLRRRGKAAHGA